MNELIERPDFESDEIEWLLDKMRQSLQKGKALRPFQKLDVSMVVTPSGDPFKDKWIIEWKTRK